ncbi:MAG: lysophospholipid acyltransferase family protein [Alphaproteobacteria bacterium]|nr:lysophospholipid acyltransferase family protein [Alphaproteobacteria bacterium]
MTPRQFFKQVRKSVLRSDTVRGLACWLAAKYIRLIFKTQKVEVENAQLSELHWNQGKPFILVFWHGRLLMMPYIWRRDHSIHMLVSQHRDGLLIARTMAYFGISTIAGSSTRGAGPALRAIMKKLKEGSCIGLTPDGPKGPRMRSTDGIINIARLSGAPIIPATYSASPCSYMNSWDRFQVPRPFGRGIFIWGEPIEVPRDADEAEVKRLNLLLEERLNDLTARADRHVGLVPIEPAPLSSEAKP